MLLASVPQTARVNKKTIQAPEVAYDGGQPKFEPIEKTTVSRAVNTDKDILKVGDLYYMCFQGVWFMSRAATGPWEVTGEVPKEIYEIPVSSPSYNVTYVTVEDDNDEWATFAVAAACWWRDDLAWGCAVWGTEVVLPPYYGSGLSPYYPTATATARVLQPVDRHLRSWLCGLRSLRRCWATPPVQSENRRVFAQRHRCPPVPYTLEDAAEAYNPRTGGYAQTRQGSNVYGSWGSTSVQRGDQWATTSRVTNNRTGATTRVTQGSGGGTAVMVATPPVSLAAASSGQAGSGDVCRRSRRQRLPEAGRRLAAIRRRRLEQRQHAESAESHRSDRPDRRPNRTGRRTGRRASPADSSTMSQLDRLTPLRATRARSEPRTLGSVRSGTTSLRPSSYRPSGGMWSRGSAALVVKAQQSTTHSTQPPGVANERDAPLSRLASHSVAGIAVAFGIVTYSRAGRELYGRFTRHGLHQYR